MVRWWRSGVAALRSGCGILLCGVSGRSSWDVPIVGLMGPSGMGQVVLEVVGLWGHEWHTEIRNSEGGRL